jgi:sulfur relay (sulfurtransferase) DsrF/TusC family protein
MAKKTLNIVESAYRAVMEEQDDTILWLLAAMQGAGAEHTVVLRGNAVNYAVAGQGAPGLTIGGWQQTTLAPRMDNDVIDLIETRKIPVFVIEEDLAARGIDRTELVHGVQLLSSKMLPKRMAEYEIVSHW